MLPGPWQPISHGGSPSNRYLLPTARDHRQNQQQPSAKLCTVQQPLANLCTVQPPPMEQQPSATPCTGKQPSDFLCTVQLPAMKSVFNSSPHDMPNWINVPKVDAQIISRQQDIFHSTWPTVTALVSDKFPDFAQLYSCVKTFNLPNFMGAKRTVPSKLNLPIWESMLKSYHDNEICFLLALTTGGLLLTYLSRQERWSTTVLILNL